MLYYFVMALLCVLVYLSYTQRQSNLFTIELPFLSHARGKLLSVFWKGISLLIEILTVFFFVSLVLYCAAGGGPCEKFYEAHFGLPKISSELSRKIFFVVDHSGSMGEPMPGYSSVPKISVVKEGITEAIVRLDKDGGESDLLGLATFARAMRVVAPLTKDRAFFYEVLSSITPETIENLNGTAIGYAIFKASILIIACSDIARVDKRVGVPSSFDSTIVVLTDGLEEPNPADATHPYRSMRTLQALRFAKDNDLCVHYINVDKTEFQRMLPEERDRLIEAVEATGGAYKEAMNPSQVSEILQKIIAQKKAETIVEEVGRSGAAIVFLIGMTLLVLLIGRGIETILLRVTL